MKLQTGFIDPCWS